MVVQEHLSYSLHRGANGLTGNNGSMWDWVIVWTPKQPHKKIIDLTVTRALKTVFHRLLMLPTEHYTVLATTSRLIFNITPLHIMSSSSSSLSRILLYTSPQKTPVGKGGIDAFVGPCVNQMAQLHIFLWGMAWVQPWRILRVILDSHIIISKIHNKKSEQAPGLCPRNLSKSEKGKMSNL